MKKTICLLLLAMTLTGCGSSGDIGIIGGADGPTAIIVGEQAETVTLTDMPAGTEFPLPPGMFREGWELPDTGMLYLVTENVEEETFRQYSRELQDGGYTSVHCKVENNNTDDRINYVTWERDGITIQLVYSRADQTVTFTAQRN